MSPYLNIPLSRSRKTTRRPRRVVWLLSGLIAVCVLVLWQICVIWFTGIGGLKAAPEGTQAALQLFVNKHTWPVLETILSSTPLISNRNLTLSDLASSIQGELILFFTDDGSQSVVVRSSTKQIPTTLLDAHHIVVQKVSQHLFLLSEKLQPISGMKTKRSFRSLFPSFSLHLGSYVERESKIITPILHKNRMISLKLPGEYPEKRTFDSRSIPQSGYLVLSTPVYTKSTHKNQMTQLFSSMAHSLLSEESRTIFQTLLSSPGLIMVQNPANPSFLLVSDQVVDEKERIRLIQTMLALKYPQKQQKYLKDRTVVQELVSDPGLISVEQRIISGQEFQHATTGSASLFMSKSGHMILTDNEDMLKFWLNKDSTKNVSKLCNANTAYLSIEKLLETNLYPTDRYAQDISRILAESFTDITLESSGKSTKLHLCY